MPNIINKKKNFKRKKIKFTIVTVVLNAEKDLQSTIKSVMEQTYKNMNT